MGGGGTILGDEPSWAAEDAIKAEQRAPARCTLPPPGWTCTRALGHQGPCAAHQTPVPLEGEAVRQLASNVVQARLGGKVERCHNIPHHGSYSNAAHSWGVGMLLWHLWPEDFGRLGIYCLTHDVPEGIVGDIPAPTARYLPGLKGAREHVETKVNHSLGLPAEAELEGDDLAKVKACDRLEFWLWCREQLLMGNVMVKDGLDEMERYFREVPLPDRAQRLYEALRERDVRPLWAGVMKELCE